MKIYSELSNEDYHSLRDHISSSFVKNVAKHSIAKALEKTEPTPALIFGDAMHTYFEDTQKFKERFTIFDDSKIIAEILERRPDITVPTMTKEYKTYKKNFEEDLDPDKMVLSQDDFEKIHYMYKSSVDNTALQEIYDDHIHTDIWDEYSFVTEDEDDWGLLYRVRPDRLLVLNNIPVAAIDWKSCRDASEKAFRTDFWRFRYDLQAAFYCDILQIPMDQFFYVAIEKEFPYNSAVFSLDEDTQQKAYRELELIKERIGKWKENPSPQTVGLANANTITYL